VRGPPGPAPPKSWLTSSIHAPKHLRDRARVAAAQRAAPDRLDRLPGSNIPDKSSLLHHCLKAIARDWKWHVEYDQYYLATMPVTVKATLLSYIAVYSDGDGLDIDGLRTLFLDDTELHGATGSEEIKHLDLAGSVGQSITFKQLEQYFANCTSTPEHPPPPPQAPATDEIDSWEAEADTILSQPLHTSRFPNLTHLSLSHPSPTTSWPRFLAFAPHLATLTHLSLAYWPTPCLTPNAKTTTTSSKYSPSVSYGCSNFYSASEGDWSEAAGVLMRLSRATYCLKWLDLEGCGEWLAALKWEGESGGGVEWCGGWRGMETVRVHAGWIPEDMVSLTVCDEREGGKGTKTQYHTPEGAESLGWDVEDERRKYHMRQDVIAWQQVHTEARAVEAWVRSKRRLIGGLRITFEDDRERIK